STMAQVTVSPSPAESTPIVPSCRAPSDATEPFGAVIAWGMAAGAMYTPARLPGAGGAEARSRRGGLRLRPGRLLGHRQRLVLSPDQGNARGVLPSLRRSVNSSNRRGRQWNRPFN